MKVAILGYGTVGSGVFEIMRSNQDGISRRAGEEVEVKYVLDLRNFPGDAVEDVLAADTKIIKGVYYMHFFFLRLRIL